METIQRQLFEEQTIQQFKEKFVFIPFEYPDLLMSEPPSLIKVPIKQQQETSYSLNLSVPRQLPRNKCNQNKTHRQEQANSFFNLIKMFFPEISGEGIQPLDIQIVDTIFYTSENSPVYIYTDSKKGITRLKSKNCCEFFLKRRAQFQHRIKIGTLAKSKDKFTNSISNRSILSENQENSKKEKGYIAILKYKDDSYIRLKQNDFKSIFCNPLHANQKFKNINNTQCFQMLPIDQDNQTVVIDFSYCKFKNQKLFQLAIKLVCQESSSSSRNLDIKSGKKLSKFVKQSLKLFHQHVQLYFIAFQVYSYLSIHYNKKLEEASFYFIRNDSNGFSLSNINRITIRNFSTGKQQFYRHSLMPIGKGSPSKQQKQAAGTITNETEDLQFYSQKQNIFGEKQKELSLLQETLINYFDKQNNILKKNLSGFVRDKFQSIKNSKDQKLSNMIFRTMNPTVKDTFEQILNDDNKFYQLIKNKKQNQSYYTRSVDGFSFVIKNAKKNCKAVHKFTKQSESENLEGVLNNPSKFSQCDQKFNKQNVQPSKTNLNLTKSRLDRPGTPDLFQLSKFYCNKKSANAKGKITQKKSPFFSRVNSKSIQNQGICKKLNENAISIPIGVSDPNSSNLKDMKHMMKRISSASFKRA